MRKDLDANLRAMSERSNLTRRGLLQRAACGAAAAAFSPIGRIGLAIAAEEISPAMSQLSKYMSEAGKRALPDKVLEETKHHALDTVAAMVSGSELPPGKKAIQFARGYGGERISTVVASNVLCGPIEAAVANGELAHSDETDDDFTGGGAHPGAAIVPASLALGEMAGIGGTLFLRAMALGYDVGMRVSKALGPDMVLRDTHNLIGTFGAAAAGGCILSLNEQQMRWLIDYAGQQAGSGIGAWRRDTEHIEKGFVFAGSSARNGVMAAMLVQQGWTGVNDIMAGSENFLQSYSPKADASQLTNQLGERYEMTLTTIKRWTTGGPIQSPLDALQLILKMHPFEPDQVKQVVVHAATSAAFTVNNREMPDICLQHMVAVMLIDKTASFKAAHDKPRMHDPEVLRQRAKVQLIGEEELEKLLPKRVAIVEVTLNDGTKLTERVDAVRGTPENPMNREEVVAKARDLMAPVLGAAKCDALIEKFLNFESVKDVRELRPLLQRA
ncbi:MAG TPA: MmgE/PrpD family protein [Candidatus Acidoferrales bacterium]|nr:MmgE/PrpD family protein [Candidatus Acidoferrales bacterium]